MQHYAQSLLRKLFAGAKPSKTKTTISTYGDQTTPKGSGNSLLRKERETPHLRVPTVFFKELK